MSDILSPPNVNEPIVDASNLPTRRLHRFLAEVARRLNVDLSDISDIELEAYAANSKGSQALALIDLLDRLATLTALAPVHQQSNHVLADYIRLNTELVGNTGHPGLVGEVSWNKEDDTPNIHHSGGVIQQVGHETYAWIFNDTGSQIDNGKVVGFGGVYTSGDLKGILMIADGTIPSLYILGVATQDIPNGTFGRVTTYGKVRGIDTSAFSAEDILYVSPTTAGAFTTTKPTAPNFSIPVAVVLESDATSGVIDVRPTVEQPLYYGSFSKTSDATPAAVNTAYSIVFDNADSANGFSLGTPASRVVAANSGRYSVDVSFQLTSGTAAPKLVWLWFRKNGTDIARTAMQVSLESATATTAVSRNYSISMQANDYIEAMWAADDTNVTLDYQAATAFAPEAPACILNIEQTHQ